MKKIRNHRRRTSEDDRVLVGPNGVEFTIRELKATLEQLADEGVIERCGNNANGDVVYQHPKPKDFSEAQTPTKEAIL